MEELQDAIEDAQYMNAIHDDVPKPTKEWKWPVNEELQGFLAKIKATNPHSLEAEGFCRGGSLGLYLFMRFCKEQGSGAKLLAGFIEDVATFRVGFSQSSTAVISKKIESDYVVNGSGGNADDPPKRRAANITRNLISMSGKAKNGSISLSSSRTVVANMEPAAPIDGPVIAASESTKESDSLWKQYMSLDTAKNAIKVVGAPVDRVIELLRDIDPQCEVEVKGTILKIKMDIFDELDEIVFSYLRDAYYESFKRSIWWTKHHQYLCLTERKVVEDDFAIFRVLGRGGFGLVNACKRCTTGKLYAMKMLNKKRIKMKKAEALCLQERNILAIIHSPYVVCLKYAFATPTDLYLILDLMTGGDLGFHLTRKGRFSEKEAKYYAARTLLGLASMHEKNIVYRDLKPENILMDEEGYTKISDLGLACKVGRSGLSGTCGTRGYWAPEMLRRDSQDKRERYSVTVDWFSFGCCVYEFMYGISPFRTDKARKWGDFPKTDKADRDKAIDLAIQQMDPEFDDHVFDHIIKDLLLKLLCKDGKHRLGANGYKEIIAHPWFASIDWDNIAKSKPPMKPSAKDINTATQSEIGSFTDEKLSKKFILTEEDHKTYEKW
eukprot:CAMPEP_0119055114 /NCGR_PEP_ID=MMETSP1177-20130426/75519_1 /TAXON_ID=2985 /ORGANISM="Ochromonas sp, Strain CCMP1899" /LENGTH=607 /DNA_ID=CAMNT_0007035569 /DNA_START=227 /DNA_END=2047 /DNA_ORIENTATION=+